MKVLVSYMFSNGPLAITRGHTDLEMQYWDTKAVTEKLGEFLNVDPTTIIISSVFEIPTSRFTQQKKLISNTGYSSQVSLLKVMMMCNMTLSRTLLRSLTNDC